jgi:hypothetical protein
MPIHQDTYAMQNVQLESHTYATKELPPKTQETKQTSDNCLIKELDGNIR